MKRLGSGLEHQLPVAKAFTALHFHHLHSFIHLGLESVPTGVYCWELGLAWMTQPCAALLWDSRMGSAGCFVMAILIRDTSKYDKEAVSASRRPSWDCTVWMREALEKRRVWREWEISLPSQPSEAIVSRQGEELHPLLSPMLMEHLPLCSTWWYFAAAPLKLMWKPQHM